MAPRSRLLLVAVLLTFLWTVPLAGAGGQSGLPAWGTEPSPNGPGGNFLTGISVGSATDIWAVGRTMDAWRAHSLTLHFDGSTWAIVPSPTDEGLRLEDVVTIGPADAWAVGWTGSPSSLDDRNVAMHWDGTSWSIVATPQPGGVSVDRLLAVDAAAPNDVWAVGTYWDASGYEQHSVILHWDGVSWRIVQTGRPLTTRRNDQVECDTWGGLTGITVVTASNVWAVGDSTTCHFDGMFWTEVPSPQPRREHYEIAYPLEDVSAASPTDIWAVGARILDGPFQISWDTLAEHWDGTEWTRHTIDIPVGQVLLGVDAVASNDVWAVGGDDYGAMIIHYDGSSWSRVPTPEANRAGHLAGVGSAAPDNLWAAGDYQLGTLIEHAPSSTQGAVLGQTNVAYATVSWFGPENGSIATDPSGAFQVGGLQAGTYTFVATEPGCGPDSRTVNVVPGVTLQENFHINCDRARRARTKAPLAVPTSGRRATPGVRLN
jgi:hypothetical protein